MSTVAVNLVFSALADSTRRHVLERLAVGGAASASTLARELPVSRQAIVKHMSVLEDAGLVSRKRNGREIVFNAEAHQLAATARWMQRMAERWDPVVTDFG